MSDESETREHERNSLTRPSAARRMLLGAASPFVGYFDRRFQDVQEHLDDQDRRGTDLRGQLDHLVVELRQTRADVAADADTIAELAFTLERFADLFTARMESLAAALTVPPESRGAQRDTSSIALPFSFAVAGTLPVGASALTVDDDGALSDGLAALGFRVHAIEAAPPGPVHPAVVVIEEGIGDWTGPDEPVDAVFARLDTSLLTQRESVSQFRKWLGPDGTLVVASGIGSELAADRHHEWLDGWDVEREVVLERGVRGEWHPLETPGARASAESVTLVRATPRP